MTVGGQAVNLGGGATHAGILIQNDIPGDRIQMSSPVLLNDGRCAWSWRAASCPSRPLSPTSRAGTSARCPAGIRAGRSSPSPTRTLVWHLIFSGAIDVAPIPEPATSLLVLAGLAALGRDIADGARNAGRRIMRHPKTTALALLVLAQAVGIAPAGAITLFVTGTITESFYVDRSPFPIPGTGALRELVRAMGVGDTFEVAIDYLDLPAISGVLCTHLLGVGPDVMRRPGHDPRRDVRVRSVPGGTILAIGNDSPGDLIDVSGRLIDADLRVLLAGGPLPIATAFGYQPSGNVGAFRAGIPAVDGHVPVQHGGLGRRGSIRRRDRRRTDSRARHLAPRARGLAALGAGRRRRRP